MPKKPHGPRRQTPIKRLEQEALRPQSQPLAQRFDPMQAEYERNLERIQNRNPREGEPSYNPITGKPSWNERISNLTPEQEARMLQLLESVPELRKHTQYQTEQYRKPMANNIFGDDLGPLISMFGPAAALSLFSGQGSQYPSSNGGGGNIAGILGALLGGLGTQGALSHFYPQQQAQGPEQQDPEKKIYDDMLKMVMERRLNAQEAARAGRTPGSYLPRDTQQMQQDKYDQAQSDRASDALSRESYNATGGPERQEPKVDFTQPEFYDLSRSRY